MNATDASVIVNNIVKQAFGKGALQTLETEGLVSVGNRIISSQNNTEAFLNTLMGLEMRTIYTYRKYRNKLRDLVLSNEEFGQFVRKISMKMPESENDGSVSLTDGASVDHYVVHKPEINVKYFWTRAPYQFTISVQRWWLVEAFKSYEQMGEFITLMFSKVRNKVEFSMELLGRLTLSNYMALVSLEGGNRVRNLLTEWKSKHKGSTLTAADALDDPDFLRYVVAEIRQQSKEMTDICMLYNDGTEDRFTPFEDQRLKVISRVQTQLETQVEYAAFHKDLVSIKGFQELNYWQSKTSPYAIKIIPEGKEDPVQVNNIIAMLYDRDALGTYRDNELTATTPLNAVGLYYNTVFHERQMWFNDPTENCVIFTLN